MKKVWITNTYCFFNLNYCLILFAFKQIYQLISSSIMVQGNHTKYRKTDKIKWKADTNSTHLVWILKQIKCFIRDFADDVFYKKFL